MKKWLVDLFGTSREVSATQLTILGKERRRPYGSPAPLRSPAIPKVNLRAPLDHPALHRGRDGRILE